MNILVSACLLGVNCRYNGTGELNKDLESRMGKYNFIPVCPEQLGGMTTPRRPSERIGDSFISVTGEDVTNNFMHGANETLKIARLYECSLAILKERSPSCGYGKIYDGTFSGKLTSGNGITAELLATSGIKVIGESKINNIL